MKAAFGLLVLLLAFGCGSGDAPPAPAEPPPSPSPSQPTPSETTPSEPATPKPTLPPTQGGGVPEGNLRGDARSGAALYSQYCATCHGPSGKGDGPLSASLVPKPADHTNSAYMGSLSDAHLYTVIQKGGAAVGKSALMAPWGGVLNDADIRDVVAYLREISGT